MELVSIRRGSRNLWLTVPRMRKAPLARRGCDLSTSIVSWLPFPAFGSQVPLDNSLLNLSRSNPSTSNHPIATHPLTLIINWSPGRFIAAFRVRVLARWCCPFHSKWILDFVWPGHRVRLIDFFVLIWRQGEHAASSLIANQLQSNGFCSASFNSWL